MTEYWTPWGHGRFKKPPYFDAPVMGTSITKRASFSWDYAKASKRGQDPKSPVFAWSIPIVSWYNLHFCWLFSCIQSEINRSGTITVDHFPRETILVLHWRIWFPDCAVSRTLFCRHRSGCIDFHVWGYFFPHLCKRLSQGKSCELPRCWWNALRLSKKRLVSRTGLTPGYIN